MAISVETAQMPRVNQDTPRIEYRNFVKISPEPQGVIIDFAAPLTVLQQKVHTTSSSELNKIVEEGIGAYWEALPYSDKRNCSKNYPPRLHIGMAHTDEIVQKGREAVKKAEEAKSNGKSHSYY